MSTTSITIRMDENLKKQFETALDNVGMNMTTGINVFAKAVVRNHGIPFEVKADPFWGEENQAELRRRVAELDSGKATLIAKTMAELEAMEHE